MTLPFFDLSGSKKLMERDRLNLRDQRHHEEDLVSSILENGVVPSVRGAPWARYGADGVAQMITWGSLSSAAYEAHRRQPTNPQVLASLAAGVTFATIWNGNTPDDVISWLKKYHNQFHTGAGYSFVECLEELLG